MQREVMLVAKMVTRVEQAIADQGVRELVKYSPRVRRLEVALDDTAQTPERFTAALEQLEEGWMVEIAKARRLR